MNTTGLDLAIAIVATIGLLAIACGSQPTPDVDLRETSVPSETVGPAGTQNGAPGQAQGQTSSSLPPPQGGGVGTILGVAVTEAGVEGARIELGSDDGSTTAELVISTRRYECQEPPFGGLRNNEYPWPTGWINNHDDCDPDQKDDGEYEIVLTSVALGDDSHIFEACNTYLVEVNGERLQALATSSGVACPSESAQPAPGEALALTRIDDVRLSYPSTEPGPLLIGDYNLTLSWIRPGMHLSERDGDRVKVYVSVSDLDTRLPSNQAQQCRPVTEGYSIPLEGFTAGQSVDVWMNGTVRTLVVPERGQVTEPAVRVTGPSVQGGQVQVAQNQPPRPTQITVDPAAILPTQERYGVTPDGSALFTAPVEEVRMAQSDGTGTAPTLSLVTGLPNGCQEFAKYEVTGFNPELSVNVTNRYRPPSKDGVCGDSYSTVETHIDLDDFELGRTYQTCTVYNIYVNGTAHRVQVQPASSSEPCP